MDRFHIFARDILKKEISIALSCIFFEVTHELCILLQKDASVTFNIHVPIKIRVKRDILTDLLPVDLLMWTKSFNKAFNWDLQCVAS